MGLTVGLSLLRCRAVREERFTGLRAGHRTLWKEYVSGLGILGLARTLSQCGSYSVVARCTCTWRALCWTGKRWTLSVEQCVICGALFWKQRVKKAAGTCLK
jgi:hypothetical protein